MERHPVDEKATDDRLDLRDRGRLEVDAGKHRAEPPGLIVREADGVDVVGTDTGHVDVRVVPEW